MTPKNFATTVLIKTLFIFACLINTAFNNTASATTKNKTRIGFILPLTGEWSFLGQGIRNGALLANESLGKDSKLDLVFEDNQGSQAKSSAIAQKLINTSNSDILVSIFSGVAQVIKPIATKNKVLHFGICSDETINDNYNFTYYITASQAVTKFLKHFKETTSSRNLGIYSQNEAGFLRIIQELEKLSNENSTKIEFIEKFNSGTNDFRSLIVKNLDSKVSNILLLSLSPDIEILAKQLRELGYKGDFTSIEAFDLTQDKNLFKNMWHVSAPISNEFAIKYKDKYKIAPTLGAMQSYELMFKLQKLVNELTSSIKENSNLIEEMVNVIRSNKSNEVEPEIRSIK